MEAAKDAIIVRCLKCGRKNRIPGDHLGDRALCGHCHASLDELFIQCLQCGRLNRIPGDRVHDLPVCGKCGSRLYNDYVRDVTEETFDRDILNNDETVIVCCWAPGCLLCDRAMPALKKLAPKYLGRLKLYRLNIEENARLASRYSITSTPSYMLFKKGVLVKTIEKIVSVEDLERNLRLLATR